MLRIGFLTELVQPAQLSSRTAEYIDALRACVPNAVRSMKRQLNAIANNDPTLRADRSAYEQSLQSPVIAERIRQRRG